MITSRYINPLFQFGIQQYDLIIESDQFDPIRVERQFPADATDQDLQAEADRTVQQILNDKTAASDPVSIDIPIALDLPDEFDVAIDAIAVAQNIKIDPIEEVPISADQPVEETLNTKIK